ncbi:phosphatase PAP2 family protein [Acidisphaera sp. L21]|uniref:phosphatase PAP2 family protein n=1 Tax=Acidisphaera sp. L21 TaxID=1641851 RepID=UPI00131B0319|nr:phosphatase PAP2 family protein [Acidisphaera sp. L21]
MKQRMAGGLAVMLTMAVALAPIAASAQPASTLATSTLASLRGLAPVTTLPNTPAGQAALAGNYTVTGGIQAGTIQQPTLLPFAEQQQLALRDAFITGGNATQLADSLGTLLGTSYQSLAKYESPKQFTSIAPSVAALIAYTSATTGSGANAGKFFFANKTTDGKTPAADPAMAVMAQVGGVADVFGRAYAHPAGTPGNDPFGNSRPFQTEPGLTPVSGPDYFGKPATNTTYLRGPDQDLTESPSYPSGHTTYGTTESVLLAILVPERYQQAMTRAAEYGNNRIILGAHYTMDVIGGRTLALHDVAHLLANDPAYVGQSLRGAPVITDFQGAVKQARADLTQALTAKCGDTMPVCAAQDVSRFANPAANEAFYTITLTYGLPVVFQSTANTVEDVGKVAPEAGYLLTTAFPYLTLVQANAILTATEGPGGGFLDNGSEFGLYSRLNMVAAAKRAAAMAPH